MKTVLSVEVKDANDYEDEVIKEEEDHSTAMEDGDFEESSTIMSGMDEGEFEDIDIKFEWDYEELEDSNWAPMARAHCKALKLLVDALKTTSKTSAKELRVLECGMQTVMALRMSRPGQHFRPLFASLVWSPRPSHLPWMWVAWWMRTLKHSGMK